MHYSTRSFALFLTLLFLSCSVFSQSAQVCSAERVIFSVNGVLTDAGGAQENSDILEERYLAAYPTEPSAPRFKVLHNPSGKKLLFGVGGVIDFIEVLMQQTGLGISRLIRMVMGLELITEPYNSVIGQVMSNAAVSGYNADPGTLNNMLLRINADINQGSKVLLVAHSQGNLWANSVIALVNNTTARGALAQVGVGVPDSRLEKSPVSHVTLTEDFIIRPIPFSLAANETNGYSFLGILSRTLGHNYVSAYMDSGTASESRILNGVKTSFSSLSAIPNPSGQGPFTVTLTWGAQPDVDLHIFEPNGTHVYYGAPSGTAGYLDVDDVTSFGPEHYYSDCTRIITGEYRIGVNYYSGRSPEVATVLIQAGTNSFSRQISLPVERGSSGNNSPVPVARVVVQRDPSTGAIEASIVP